MSINDLLQNKKFLKIIKNNKINDDSTELIVLCNLSKQDKAIKLIRTSTIDIVKPEYINDYGQSAFMIACMNDLEQVALKMLDKYPINKSNILKTISHLLK